MTHFRTNLNQEELGRSMQEILAVLAIVGVLSIVGVWSFNLLQEKHEENELANQIALNAVQIKTALQSGKFQDKESFEKFLGDLTMPYKHYTLSYHASDTFNQTYIMEIRDKDGDYIKGKKCRQILKNLAKNQESTNVSFIVDDEDTKTEETIWLADKKVTLRDICGG